MADIDFPSRLLPIGTLTILWCALAYFVYGGLNGVFGILILSILLSIAFFLCLIPIAGIILYFLLSFFVIIPKVLAFTGLHMTWLVTVMFAVDMIIGAIVSIVMTLAFLDR